MSAFPSPSVPQFAGAVASGLAAVNKKIASRYLFDETGSALFDVISRLQNNGVGSAEARLVRRSSCDLKQLLRPNTQVADLAGGSNGSALQVAGFFASHAGIKQATNLVDAEEWFENASKLVHNRSSSQPLLLLLLGGAAGGVDRATFQTFIEKLKSILKTGDHVLFSADLVKDSAKILADYNDEAGIISAFHKNLLVRINRELAGHVKVNNFDHVVKWDAFRKRVEFHLVSKSCHDAYIGSLGRRFPFKAGESICTEFAFKFSELELEYLAGATGFRSLKTWIDIEKAFAQVLWAV